MKRRFAQLLLAAVLLSSLAGMWSLYRSGQVRFDQQWRTASRASAGIAPKAGRHPAALVQLYQARAFSWRGFFGVHTWVALKAEGADAYTVLEVLGWNLLFHNKPLVSVQKTEPDRLWFAARPELLFEISGEQAVQAIPKLLAAAESYPFPKHYWVWPGPNSNTFTAHLLREVPEMRGAELPATAIGKDFLPGLAAPTPSHTGWQLSLAGLAGLLLGWEEGVEINLLGLTFGLDWHPPALKLPVWGRIELHQDF
ncbi:MAG: DUF3750 domain-containing protein [Magnetococcales bacterium]|nr:DUF3750 domain-containing protein [Magnetococcales bacterium]